VGIAGDQRTLGVVSDPWYVFEPNAREDLALPDGSKATLRVSRSAKPRRVSAEFRAGDVPYRFDATADGVPDLLELSRAVVVCAQQRLAGNASATAATRCVRAGGPAPTTDPRPEVFPPTTALRVGETQQFVAAHQEAGCFDAPASVTWTLSPPSLGTITPDGVFTAREAGTGTVTATTSGFTRFTGSASVRVDR
jgi:hypothetical protein